jgi:C-terminal processing protease CtpA/Prc
VDGREPYPWPEALHTVGLRIERDSAPRIGVSTAPDAANAIRVMEVVPGSTASAAGVRTGDVMLQIGDVDVSDPDFGAKFRMEYAGRPAGSPLTITVQRGGVKHVLHGTLVYGPTAPRISEEPTAGARAVRLRNGILHGTTGR